MVKGKLWEGEDTEWVIINNFRILRKCKGLGIRVRMGISFYGRKFTFFVEDGEGRKVGSGWLFF